MIALYKRTAYLALTALYLCFSANLQSQNPVVDISPFDPRICDNPCTSNDLEVLDIFIATMGDGTGTFDPTGCIGSDSILFACFTFMNNSNSARGAVFMAIDILFDNSPDTLILVCFPGTMAPSATKDFCVEFNYKCNNTVEIKPAYIGWRAANGGGDQCPDNPACGPSGLHPPGKCIGYVSAEIVCMNGGLSVDCPDPCIASDLTDLDGNGVPDECDPCLQGGPCDAPTGMGNSTTSGYYNDQCMCVPCTDDDNDGWCLEGPLPDCDDDDRKIGVAGSPCPLPTDNQNNVNDWNGVLQDDCSTCVCVDLDQDNICDSEDGCPEISGDIGDPCMVASGGTGTIDNNCECQPCMDDDNDGICNDDDDCDMIDGTIGDPCDFVGTDDGIINSSCECEGCPDDDNDGICNDLDDCDMIDGTIGDPCDFVGTDDGIINSSCLCVQCLDDDNDNICNDDDDCDMIQGSIGDPCDFVGTGDGIISSNCLCESSSGGPDPIVVPTLSEWSLIILGLLVCIIGIIAVREKSLIPE